MLAHWPPGCVERRTVVTPDLAAAVLEALADAYGCVVVDTPNWFSDQVLRALDRSELVVVVATPDLIGAKAALATLHVLDQLTIPREHVLVVLNAPNGGVERKQLEQLLRQPIAVAVPYAPAFREALNGGRPLALQEERRPTAALAALRDLAKQVEQRLTAVGQRVSA